MGSVVEGYSVSRLCRSSERGCAVPTLQGEWCGDCAPRVCELEW